MEEVEQTGAASEESQQQHQQLEIEDGTGGEIGKEDISSCLDPSNDDTSNDTVPISDSVNPPSVINEDTNSNKDIVVAPMSGPSLEDDPTIDSGPAPIPAILVCAIYGVSWSVWFFFQMTVDDVESDEEEKHAILAEENLLQLEEADKVHV